MFTPDLPRCGRPGRTGQPCKSLVLSGRPACGLHLTDSELQLYSAHQAGRQEMAVEMAGEYHRGFEAGRLAAQREIATTYRPRRSQSVRLNRRGDQYVTCGERAYIWRGPGELAVGDAVFVPSMVPGVPHQMAVVTALGSVSIGVHPFIIGRVPGGGSAA